MKRYVSTVALLIAPILACGDDDPTAPSGPVTFDVRIENVSAVFDFISSGVFDTPVGAGAPGPAGPGQTYSVEFDAPLGSNLSFATMFVQSNDLFYAPDGAGIALWNGTTPTSGDVTSQVDLWDAGTEVDEEPGVGANQAPRQGGANTGDADANASVRLATDDFGNLPAVTDVIRVTITPLGGTRFRLDIENVSTAGTLAVSTGGTVAVPLAPGVFVVHDGADPLFTVGAPASADGLEAVAEDGDVGALGDAIAANTGVTSPLAPGVFAIHAVDVMPLFIDGQPDLGGGLENLAEDGDPSFLAATLAANDDVASSGAFDTPEGAAGPGPAFPGDAYTFSFEASPGDYLSFATMFVQSNDLFFGPDSNGLSLFPGGNAVSGDVTADIDLWDGGTEVNEAPGIGSNQAPRQAGADTGADEGGDVRLEDDAFDYPATAATIRVTITPRN
ncbi:MAG: spondin domain-containing protein [Gemmatimonadetes bacterium]|nr:spondin domain-containing protein [Gemmatimonadota bacterium]